MSTRSCWKKVGTVALMAIFSIIVFSCGAEQNPRYMGWNRYTDKDDGYVVLVPPKWDVIDEKMPGMRGSRIFDPTVKGASLAIYIYFSIFVRDQQAGDAPLRDRAEKLVESLTANIWCESSLSGSSGRLADLQAERFEIKGNSCYDGIPLVAVVFLTEYQGKDFILFSSATEETYPRLQENYELIVRSLRLPQ